MLQHVPIFVLSTVPHFLEADALPLHPRITRETPGTFARLIFGAIKRDQ